MLTQVIKKTFGNLEFDIFRKETGREDIFKKQIYLCFLLNRLFKFSLNYENLYKKNIKINKHNKEIENKIVNKETFKTNLNNCAIFKTKNQELRFIQYLLNLKQPRNLRMYLTT